MNNGQADKTQFVLAKPTHGAHLADMSKRLIEHDLPWHNWTPKRMVRSIKQADNVTLLCMVDNQISGFASMQFGDENAHLNLLAVESSFQNAGYATHMLEWLEESCRVAGIRDINLECRISNRHAIKFYLKRGFQRGDEIPRYYCGTETAVRMKKNLVIKA